MELEEKTNKECIDYFVAYLKENKIKEKDIIIENDNQLFFTFGDVEYSIYIEGYETIHFGVSEIFGVDIGNDFWSIRDEYGDYLYIDDFFWGVVKEKIHLDVKKIWNSLQKLEKDYDEDTLREVVSNYFGMIE
jgi:hypothetical protein